MPETKPTSNNPETYRDLFLLEGKVAIVTGAVGHLGSAISKGLASFGAKVILVGRTEEKLKSFVDQNREAFNDKFEYFVCDVTNHEEFKDLVRRVVSKYGKIDILVNNAASEKRKGLGLLVNNQLQLLRSQGALNSEILKAEALYRKQAGLQDTANEKLARQLGIQRAINEEKELGNQVSQRTQILAKIAREEGIKTAISIGRVLKGEQDFDIFLRIGGKPLEVFKKEFSQIFQEQLDIKFLRKKGFNIPVALEDEAFIRGTKKNLAGLALQIARLKSNTDATNNNTIAIRDLIAKQTPGIDGRAKTIGLRQPTSTFAERQQALQRSQSVTRREFLDITVKVDSFEGRFQGSPEAIRQLAQRVSVEVAQAVEDKIVNDIKNKPQSPSAQAVDQRINEF
ncbi:MAG: SDR family NAD(P)-dependent oxidoreductase [Bacteroidetes bacterium]|nr:SDR family NAD(P)-dependent oxidoreductase [Bacteroidota bacterium]